MSLRPEIWVVAGDLSRVVMPAGCAACGADTIRVTQLTRAGHETLLVPHCEGCLERGARNETTALSAGLLACLAAIGGSLAFPLAWPLAGLGLHLASATALALVPALAGAALLAAGGRIATRSVRWMRRGELACRSGEFARELGRQSGMVVTRRRAFDVSLHPLSALALSLAVVLSCFSHYLHHPRLLVVNLSGERLWLNVDGREMAAIEPTLGESPGAGLALRVPRGAHHLTASNGGGQVVSDAVVRFQSWREHVYAPASEGHCFWLESTGYGRERQRRVVPLASESRFWQLEPSIDIWFAAAPEPAESDTRSSGGVLTAIRYASCHQAPPSSSESPQEGTTDTRQDGYGLDDGRVSAPGG